MVKKFRAAAAHRESGFTLIEVMIAMTILSVGLMSIAVAQLTAIKVSSRSKHMQDAMFLARERMDTLIAIDPTINTFFATAQTIDDPAPIQVGNDDGDATRYTRRTQIFPNQPQGNLARVVVTVIWTNGNLQGTQQIQITSVMRMS
jgi:prepilin-type N-terminal cleavage/methylation domain-containing protein